MINMINVRNGMDRNVANTKEFLQSIGPKGKGKNLNYRENSEQESR